MYGNTQKYNNNNNSNTNTNTNTKSNNENSTIPTTSRVSVGKQLVSVYELLGEVSEESENFELAYENYLQAYNVMAELGELQEEGEGEGEREEKMFYLFLTCYSYDGIFLQKENSRFH